MKARVAVVTTNRGAFDFREYSVPDPAPDSAIVKMICCNICGSDLHLWRGDARPLEEGLPQILGHEMVGTIHKLGTKVKTDSLGQPLQEGDRIIYSFYRQCGNCYFCNTREAACPDLHKHWIGVSSDDPPHFHAGYGEYYHLGPGHWVFKVPDNLSDDMASPVNCAGSTIFAGLDKIEIRPGDTVVVQGAGGLGLYAASMAKERGAGRIIAIDAFEQRLSLAEKFGADQLLNINQMNAEERQEAVMSVTEGRGADVCIEVAGKPAAVSEGLELLRNGGRYLWVGNIMRDRTFPLEPAAIIRKALTIKGLYGYDTFTIPKVLDFITRTREQYPFESMLSHHYPFDEINEAFAFADQGSAIRVAIEFADH